VVSPGDLEGVPPARTGTMSLRRRMRHAFRRFARRVVHRLGVLFLKTLVGSCRFTILGAENLSPDVTGSKGHFIALWHGRMLLGVARHESSKWWVLVSDHQDGDISGALLEQFGYRVVRGSSTRGGARAVRQMLTILDEGDVVIITPDGPRGPRHSIKPGVVWLARATGHSIVPVGFACDRTWRTKGWDRFNIPKPWSRIVMIYGAPIRVDRSVDEEGLATAADSLRDALFALEERAFGVLGVARDW
jgi:lysophospholipid acyltransferase (LPLAT)-like uncharacterized protein